MTVKKTAVLALIGFALAATVTVAEDVSRKAQGRRTVLCIGVYRNRTEEGSAQSRGRKGCADNT